MADIERQQRQNHQLDDSDGANSFQMDMSTSQQRMKFGEIHTPRGRLSREKKSANTPQERKTPTIGGQGINGQLKLKILRQKNELFNQMKK